MDQNVKYAEILTRVLNEEAKIQPSVQPITLAAACDATTGQFLMIATGWDNKRRVEAIIFHARLVGDLVIVEDDNTEEGISPRLIEAGIPAENIMTALTYARRQRAELQAA
jgi:hypothetical protein